MSSDFQVGDQVVCVNARVMNIYNPYNPSLHRLVEGQVYTIEALAIDIDGTLAVTVVGCYSTHPMRGWQASRFRKVQKTFTGMALLQGLLNTNTKELVDG